MMLYWLLLCSTYMFYSLAKESTVTQGLVNKQFTTSTDATTSKYSYKPKKSTETVTTETSIPPTTTSSYDVTTITTTSQSVDNGNADETSTTRPIALENATTIFKTNTTSNSSTISWLQEDVNITEYQYRFVRNLACLHEADENIMTKVIKSNATIINDKVLSIPGLQPYSQYNVTLNVTISNQHRTAFLVINTTETDFPIDEEKPNITFTQDDKQLTIGLSVVPCRKQQGPLIYSISTKCETHFCNEATHEEITETRNYTIQVFGNTTYNITVTLSSRNQTNKDKIYFYNITTNATAPPAPANLDIYSKTQSCAHLRWMNSNITATTGKVEHYIEYSNASSTIRCNSNTTIPNCDKWNGFENYFCGSCCKLTANMNYTIMVRAKNEGADKLGNFSEPRSTILKEELPGPPRNLTFSWSSFNLTLMWGHPLFANGRILAFRIYINNENISYANSNYKIPQKNYIYTIDARKYKSETLNISVCAANSAGRSTNTSIKLTFPGIGTRIINSTIPDNVSDMPNVKKDNEPNKSEFTTSLAVLICFLLVGCIIAAIRFYYVKTKPKNKSESPKEEIVTAHVSVTTAPTFSQIVNREDFKSYITQEEELQKQFQTMNSLSIKPQTVGKMQENKLKNRYQNIIPYDDMRVILDQIDGDEHSDYINASYIRGYHVERRYIAAQGPRTTTLNDFWRMIWQEHVECIVMLANLTEDGKKKCELYWPSVGDARSFNDIEVLTLQDVHIKEYIKKRIFQVECNGQTRMVTHIHFTEWPDHGVPDSPLELAELITEVRNCNIESTPIIVHCSAGIGRTGTFILCDIALDMVKETEKIDAYKIFYELRQQRCFMVQMRDQYLYAHDVIQELLEKDK